MGYTPVFSGGFIFTNAALSGSGLRDSVSAVRRDFRALTVAGIRTWGPMNVALFTFIPAHLRVAFSMVAHYFYIVMLATWMSGFLGRFMATCDEFRQLVTDAVTGRGGKTGSNTVDATTADATTAAPVASPSAAASVTGLTRTDGLEAGEAPFTRGAYNERDVVNDVAGQIVTESGSPGLAGDKEQLL